MRMLKGMFICLFAGILYTHSSQATITTIEKNVDDDVVLTCDLIGTYPAWQQGQTILSYIGDETFRHVVDKDRVFYYENNRDLYIRKLKTSDSGMYRCTISNLDNFAVQLNVTCCRETFDRRVGEHATFFCPLTGTIPEWYGPDDKLLPVYHHKLHTKHLTHGDAGIYKCNVPSAGTHSFNLNIQTINTSTTLTGYVGNEVILECKLPTPFSYWYSPEFSAGMNRYTTLEKEGRLLHHKHGRELTMHNLKTTDAGLYACFRRGVGHHTINLTIHEHSGTERIQAIMMPFVTMVMCRLITVFVSTGDEW